MFESKGEVEKASKWECGIKREVRMVESSGDSNGCSVERGRLRLQ